MASYGRSYVDTAKGVEFSTCNVPFARIRRNSSPAIFYRWCDKPVDDDDDNDPISATSDGHSNLSVRSRSLSCHATMDNSQFSAVTSNGETVGSWADDMGSEFEDLCVYTKNESDFNGEIGSSADKDTRGQLLDRLYETIQRDDKGGSDTTSFDGRSETVSQLSYVMVNDIHSSAEIENDDYDKHHVEVVNQSIYSAPVIGVDRMVNLTDVCINDPLSNVRRKLRLIMLDDEERLRMLEELIPTIEETGEINSENKFSVIKCFVNTHKEMVSLRPISNVVHRLNIRKYERWLKANLYNVSSIINANKTTCVLDTYSLCTLISAFSGNSHMSLGSVLKFSFSIVRISSRALAVTMNLFNSGNSMTAIQTLLSKVFS